MPHNFVSCTTLLNTSYKATFRLPVWRMQETNEFHAQMRDPAPRYYAYMILRNTDRNPQHLQCQDFQIHDMQVVSFELGPLGVAECWESYALLIPVCSA